ncbi:hypothetical protein [Ruegeria sp. HU-ET01832]|uniref:hypothetical protein n=1 Tax=Ruegeria sp. HU-ET01832 TaxID=3135906 RepID=UPI003340A465
MSECADCQCLGSVEAIFEFSLCSFILFVLFVGVFLEALVDLEGDTECIREFLIESLKGATLGSRESLRELAGLPVSAPHYADLDMASGEIVATDCATRQGVSTEFERAIELYQVVPVNPEATGLGVFDINDCRVDAWIRWMMGVPYN